jgi:Fe2+ or Zn2+ uptake regulation protein
LLANRILTAREILDSLETFTSAGSANPQTIARALDILGEDEVLAANELNESSVEETSVALVKSRWTIALLAAKIKTHSDRTSSLTHFRCGQVKHFFTRLLRDCAKGLARFALHRQP